MIQVRIERRHDGTISRYTVDGHAEYDEPGKDIVCASASAIAVGTYNAVESLLGLKPRYQMHKGLMRVELDDLEIDSDTQQQLNLLLEGMIVMYKTIEQSYGEYIAVTDNSAH